MSATSRVPDLVHCDGEARELLGLCAGALDLSPCSSAPTPSRAAHFRAVIGEVELLEQSRLKALGKVGAGRSWRQRYSEAQQLHRDAATALAVLRQLAGGQW